MPPGPPDPKKLAFYWSLGQIGLEMVAPLVLGLFLDHQLGWMPWGTVAGAVFGLVAGLAHLIALSNPRHQDKDQS